MLRVFPVREERGRRISVPGLFARTFSSVARPPERRRSQKREPWLAATAISTCAVVNVSRAPGLLPFSPAFLSPPPPPSFSPRTCRAEKLSSLSLSLSLSLFLPPPLLLLLFDRTGSRVLLPALNESLFTDRDSLSLSPFDLLLSRKRASYLSFIIAIVWKSNVLRRKRKRKSFL